MRIQLHLPMEQCLAATLMNLLQNAVDYRPGSRTPIIKTSEQDLESCDLSVHSGRVRLPARIPTEGPSETPTSAAAELLSRNFIDSAGALMQFWCVLGSVMLLNDPIGWMA